MIIWTTCHTSPQKIESFNIIGAAGAGKSYLIKHFYKKFEKQNKRYVLVAPTNKAALIINGKTLHKFVSKLKLKTSKQLERFNADYICVDEISMVKEVYYNFYIMMKNKKPNINLSLLGTLTN